jgi:hypothetical protein
MCYHSGSNATLISDTKFHLVAKMNSSSRAGGNLRNIIADVERLPGEAALLSPRRNSRRG